MMLHIGPSLDSAGTAEADLLFSLKFDQSSCGFCAVFFSFFNTWNRVMGWILTHQLLLGWLTESLLFVNKLRFVWNPSSGYVCDAPSRREGK